MTQPIPSLRALTTLALAEQNPHATPTYPADMRRTPLSAIASSFNLQRWRFLKTNAPSGPINIPMLMDKIEDKYRVQRPLPLSLNVHEGFRDLTHEMGLPLDLKVNHLFYDLACALDYKMNFGNNALLGEFTLGREIPVSVEELTQIQDRVRVGYENLALKEIWRTLLSDEHGARLDPEGENGLHGWGHERIRNWLNNPDNAEIINGIKSLDLNYAKLKVLPPEIGRLTGLRDLNLMGNKLKNLPESIGNLRELRKLYIDKNSLETLPESIGNLGALTELGIHTNQLRQLPESIGNLGALKDLDLENNQLRQLPNSIGNLGALTKLNLLNNQLKQLPDSIGNLGSLKTLELDDNHLEHLPESIGNLGALQGLFISGNHLEHLPESIGNLLNLKFLFSSYNYLKHLPKSIGNLTQLVTLTARNNRLEQLPEGIGNLTGLNDLDIRNNCLSLLPVSIGNLKPIATVSLYVNPLMFIFDKGIYKEEPMSWVQGHYEKSLSYTCETPFASLFQAIIRRAPSEEIEAAFSELPVRTREWIENLVRQQSPFDPSAPSSSSASSAPSLFADMDLFARQVRKVLMDKWKSLSPEEENRVYEMNFRLISLEYFEKNGTLTPENKIMYLNDPLPESRLTKILAFGKQKAFEHMVRFVDAIELVTGGTKRETSAAKRQRTD